MLDFFPTPYPEELWYSVLCRYHLRTGNVKHATTIGELFDGKAHAAMSSIFPNNSIHDVLRQLPRDLLDIDDIILRHTLFPYYFRMMPLERKQTMLRDLREGKATPPTYLSKRGNSSNTVLKYCPLCRSEDVEVYGEPYWHVDHQIPYFTACPKHACKLIEVPVGRAGKLSECFFLPGDYCVEAKADYDLLHYEAALAQTLYAYYALPYDIGPTEGYSNLAQALFNDGYRMILRKYNMTLDHAALYEAAMQFYGKNLTKKVFGEQSAAVIIARICSWKLTSPERYALLATMIGQLPEITFGREHIADTMETALVEMSSRKNIYRKKQVADKLGIKTYQVDFVARRYSIEPFWVDARNKNYNGADARTVLVKTYLTEKEKAELDKYIAREGYSSISAFMRHCLKAAILQ